MAPGRDEVGQAQAQEGVRPLVLHHQQAGATLCPFPAGLELNLSPFHASTAPRKDGPCRGEEAQGGIDGENTAQGGVLKGQGCALGEGRAWEVGGTAAMGVQGRILMLPARLIQQRVHSRAGLRPRVLFTGCGSSGPVCAPFYWDDRAESHLKGQGD